MKKYVLVGTGSRAYMYIDALIGEFKKYGTLAALCDTNPARLEYTADYMASNGAGGRPATFPASKFDEMLREHQPDAVIVTSVDRTHHRYIIAALEHGCDVITEKPLTTDEGRADEIVRAVERSGRDLRVTFNYRYAPRNSKVKELLRSGIIGKVKSVHFEWLLDTVHGADYFRRWHRDKRNSGGLMVHKSTHHFDLMNWWLDSSPFSVYALGDLVFYGKENAEARGVELFYQRGTGHSEDPFALDLSGQERLKGLYLDAESHDGYLRDQSVFSSGISIEDDISVIVRYENRAVLTYHLHAYAPWEGYRVNFNGDAGRLEFEVIEKAYASGTENDPNRVDVRDGDDFDADESERITVHPHWKPPYEVEIPKDDTGGHGGGDRRLLRHILVGAEDDELGLAADHVQGVRSILTGIAANRSMQTGAMVRIAELVNDRPSLARILGKA